MPKRAKACHITQPTLSASVTALKKSVGTDLVVRTSQFVALTEAGDLVRQYAERMLLEQEELRQELALFLGDLSGTLLISIVPQSNLDIMPFIAHCKQRYPYIIIRLSVLSNETLLSQLELHQCDTGLGFDEPACGAGRRVFHVYPQCANRMAVLMNRDEADQYAHSGDIALAKLQQHPLVLPCRTMQFRQYLERAAEQEGHRSTCYWRPTRCSIWSAPYAIDWTGPSSAPASLSMPASSRISFDCHSLRWKISAIPPF